MGLKLSFSAGHGTDSEKTSFLNKIPGQISCPGFFISVPCKTAELEKGRKLSRTREFKQRSLSDI